MLYPDDSFWQAASALMGALGIPRTTTNIKLLAAWSYCEKPHQGGGAWQWNNPWNTTEPGYGSAQTVNSAGVRVYPSQSQGIAATVATLTNGYYPQLVAALRTSDALAFFAAAGEMATWGTSMACIRQDYAALATPPARYLAAPSPGSPPPPIIGTPPATGGAFGFALAGAGLLGIGAWVLLTHENPPGSRYA